MCAWHAPCWVPSKRLDMIVMKFGGTSVQDAQAITRVTEIVRSRLEERPLVVVSAMAKVTRVLCEVAEAVRQGEREKAEELKAKVAADGAKLEELEKQEAELNAKVTEIMMVIPLFI